MGRSNAAPRGDLALTFEARQSRRYFERGGAILGFTMVLAIPQIEIYADPTLAVGPSGTIHDAAWMIETRLIDTPVVVVIDTTIEVLEPDRPKMRALLRAIPDDRKTFLLGGGPGHEPWLADGQFDGWEGGYCSLRLDGADALVEGLFRALPTKPAEDATLLLVAGQHSMFVPYTLNYLHCTRPRLRLVTAIARHDQDLDLSLRASRGGRLRFEDPVAAPSFELAIEPGHDVALGLAAGRDRPIARPPLRRVDRFQLDAITPHVDAEVFTVAATVRQPDVAWSITALHAATRAGARPPVGDTRDSSS
jgi:hypothetical protein